MRVVLLKCVQIGVIISFAGSQGERVKKSVGGSEVE